MFSRYISWLAVGLASAFLVVVSSAFTSLVAIKWLAFGISVGTLVVASGIAFRYRRDIPTLVTGVVTAAVSAWTIVASLVFSPATVQNLAFAGSLAVAGLALAGLTMHELSSERITHSLEVTESQRDGHLAAAR